MLPSKTKWNLIKPNQELSLEIDQTLSPTTIELLAQRGITMQDEVIQFLSPKLEQLHNPDHLSMIHKAVERVHRAIDQQEKILVFGDYDADGVSSTTLLIKALRELDAHCDYYIPNRFTEGYGPNENVFKMASSKGYSLIITVDTGIAAIHEAEVAKALGIDLIITDHHELQEQLPDAYAIINPKCSPDYPFQELAGVGVTFKFVECLLGYFPEQYLDLVAIGTIADLVPLLDENRVLAYYGLRALSSTDNVGLKALLRRCQIEGDVSEEDVGFSLGPRINAVGRLQDANLVVDLLLTENIAEAEELAEVVESLNKERQKIVSHIVKEAEKMVNVDDKESVIIVAKEGWNEGVLGIVASQLVRKFDRPAFVLSIKETGEAKGSARSIPAFNIFESCMEVRHLFSQFGGHSQAAGMTIPLENLDKIEQALNIKIKQELTLDDFKQEIQISRTLSISEVTEQLINELDQLAPFGMGNPRPIFRIQGIPVDVRQIGNQKKHLKLKLKEDMAIVDGIGFQMGNLYHYMTPNTAIDIVGELGINEWNGNRQTQMIIRDMQITEWQLFDQRGPKGMDIEPYNPSHENSLFITDEVIEFPQHQLNLIPQITYETEISQITPKDTVFLFSLPPDLHTLQEMIIALNPFNIHLCYDVNNSMYMKAIPTRDTFKVFYILIMKQKQIDLNKEMHLLMDAKGWSKEQIMFMANVFVELGFIDIKNNIIRLIPNPMRKDLQDSKMYRQYLNRVEIEKVLYYSTYESVKEWFALCLNRKDQTGKEVQDGLQTIY